MSSPGAAAGLRGTVYGKPPFAVSAGVETFGPGQRRLRALKLAGPLLLLAVLVIPIPGVHLSVPFLVGLALVLGWRRLRQTERITSLQGHCGCSDRPQDYELPDRLGLPLTLRCPGCREFVKIEGSGG